jgi:anion-transporting  ArsA/GET3 family ATPase
MLKNKLVAAVTLAIGSGTLFGGIDKARAEDVIALNTNALTPHTTIRSNALISKEEANADELLARGLARLAVAKQPVDFRIAYNYFWRAAKQGNAEAQFQLAIMQLDNEYVRQDEETAIRWLEKASVRGHRQAAIALDYVVNRGGDIGC